MNRRFLIHLIMDIVLFVFVLASSLWMFFGPMGTLVASGIVFLKYFTVDSNIFLGITALILVPFDFMMLLGKRSSYPDWARTLLIAANTGTSITLLTVFIFLGPTMGYGLMFEGPNMFMHLITPVIGWARTLWPDESKKPLHWTMAFFGVFPLALYGIFYLVNIVTHNGYGTAEYDWYGFGGAGLGVGILVYFMMTGFAFLVSWLFLLLQSKLNKQFHVSK